MFLQYVLVVLYSLIGLIEWYSLFLLFLLFSKERTVLLSVIATAGTLKTRTQGSVLSSLGSMIAIWVVHVFSFFVIRSVPNLCVNKSEL
ncbi:hypothetical protein COI59_13720 [Bacillus toyonensis]|nr:hypothetical protein COI59_13720 [Bacillus toyonensis]